MRADDVLTIGQVAERSGSAVSALRHYEAEGLLAAGRDGAGRRVYPRAVLRRLAFIRAGQTCGLTLAEVRQALADLPTDRVPNDQHWRLAARQWERRLDERIEALVALRAGLSACIGCGCLSLRTCALANPKDVAGTGPGPRYFPAIMSATRTTQGPEDGRSIS